MTLKPILRSVGIAIASLTIATAPASADMTMNLKVIGVGIQGGQMYILFSAPPNGCPSIAVYQAVDATGQYAMSLALAARTSGMPIARIDTHVQTGACWLDLMQL